MMNEHSMLGQNHDVYHEFPEYADRIDQLRQTNSEFAEHFDKYTAINKQVIRIEQGVDPKDHFYFEDLKKQRLLHKDKLYEILRS